MKAVSRFSVSCVGMCICVCVCVCVRVCICAYIHVDEGRVNVHKRACQ